MTTFTLINTALELAAVAFVAYRLRPAGDHHARVAIRLAWVPRPQAGAAPRAPQA